jgi:NitT/TauT family transport system ATP-binding protein
MERPTPLRIEKVSHRYGAIEVLDGIKLDIADGETVVPIGPSGCGKSTLLGPRPAGSRCRARPPAESLNPFT